MSAREWKPGDVALAYNDRYEFRVVRQVASKSRLQVGITSDQWTAADGVWPDGVMGHELQYRPLVVLDPEDREQVERLHREYDRNVYEDGRRIDAMQAAVRGLITPPKPPEPTGLGAVVEDARGERWVLCDAHRDGLNWHGPDDAARRWSQIDAVETLSEGVTQ